VIPQVSLCPPDNPGERAGLRQRMLGFVLRGRVADGLPPAASPLEIASSADDGATRLDRPSLLRGKRVKARIKLGPGSE